MEECKIKNLYNLEETIAKKYLKEQHIHGRYYQK